MSRPLIPRMSQGSPSLEVPQAVQRPRKISTACGACKQRKTRCTGGSPCDACATRNSQCIYDATADQRRKIANQRNVQDLAEAQQDLEKHRQLLGGIIATIRVGDDRANQELIHLVRTGVDLSQLAAHVRNECRSNLEIQQAYSAIDFVIDGEENLPSPTQLLSRHHPTGAEALGRGFQSQNLMSTYGGDFAMYAMDGVDGVDDNQSDGI